MTKEEKMVEVRFTYEIYDDVIEEIDPQDFVGTTDEEIRMEIEGYHKIRALVFANKSDLAEIIAAVRAIEAEDGPRE